MYSRKQQHGSKLFANRSPTSDRGDLADRSKSFFYNMVMLYINLKDITKYSNMVANTWPPTPETLGIRSKGQNSIF